MHTVEEQVEELGIIPVAVIEDAEHAALLAHALDAGGLPLLEVTFRTQAAEESIQRIAEKYPQVLVGAGTVLTLDQAHRALAAGARFIVTPGFDAELVDFCIEQGVPVFPGCSNASDITQAYKRGLRVVKFFPCTQLGGLATMDALAAAFPGLRFIPTGGINASNLGDYLASKKILACGGSWMCAAELVNNTNFDAVTERTSAAVAQVRAARA